MFCPRCGTPTNEALKFCRGCGLPMAQVSNYVATGGTANLTPGPPLEVDEYLTPGQKLALTIVGLLLMIPTLAIWAEAMGLGGEIVAIPSILLPGGIMWAIFHYKSVMRRRRNQAFQQMANLPAVPAQYIQQPPAEAYQYPPQQLPQSHTNPLTQPGRGSVIEDETQRFREGR